MSAYNCKLRVEGGNRIAHKDGTLDWGVNVNAGVLDGNGDSLGLQKGDSLKFNYGQKRTFGGKTYVYAMTTSNHSSGWFPLSAVKSADARAARRRRARPPERPRQDGLLQGQGQLGRRPRDQKIVDDTAEDPGPSGEAAGDYLPRLRTNGKRSINLIYNVPGSGLGGPAIDHFPAGTKFQRLAVPTDTGHPSLDVKLWAQSDNGHFTKAAGVMKFIYGFDRHQDGRDPRWLDGLRRVDPLQRLPLIAWPRPQSAQGRGRRPRRQLHRAWPKRTLWPRADEARHPKNKLRRTLHSLAIARPIGDAVRASS